jgi:hypothetical protein
MSNESFKRVKNVLEPLSELYVSGDAVAHDRLEVETLIASNVVYSYGKTVKSKTFTIELGTFANKTTEALSAVNSSVIAAELSFDKSKSGNMSVGTTSSGTQIINAAVDSPARVSSVYSSKLGTNGNPDTVSVAAEAGLFVSRSSTVADTVVLKVYYIE